MKQNLTLFFFSIVIIEIFLRVAGLYSDLANTTLTPSSSIYEKQRYAIQKHKYPNLYYVNSNYFDLDGVKNIKRLTTEKKIIIFVLIV